MDIRIFRKLLLPLMLLMGIAACQPLVLRPTPEPEPVVVEPEPEPEPQVSLPPDNLPASQRVRKALQMLEQGDYANARDQLIWAQQEKPGLQIADTLIEQIDADPIDYLGVKNFYYRVESGDSLSIIAGKFLDDPMKFVILARYNKLDNPSQLAPGDRVRVPGAMPTDLWHKPKKKRSRPRSAPPAPPAETRQSAPTEQQAAPGSSRPIATTVDEDDTGPVRPAVETLPPPSEPSEPFVEEPQRPEPLTLAQVIEGAKRLRAAGDLLGAISLMDQEGAAYAHEKKLQRLQIGCYREYAEQLTRQGELEQARKLLEKVVLLDATDEQAIKNLIQVEDKLESRKLYRLGSEQLSSGEVANAYELFTQAITYDPDNRKAGEAQLACRDRLTDEYHREAMRHFRQQELDQAIVLWDKILLLDPQHPLASGYKARAVEMKHKLEKIESSQR